MKVITDGKIYQLVYDNQYDMAYAFMRFQEFYETPEFQNREFPRSEVIEHYQKFKIDYLNYWDGFNVPGRIFSRFNSKFNSLDFVECDILSRFVNIKKRFYVIAYLKGDNETKEHELSHALFDLDHSYRKKVLAILKKYRLETLKKKLMKKMGYGKEVLEDELVAYFVSGGKDLKTECGVDLRKYIKLTKELRSEYSVFVH